jgi:hypothetical protein
MLEHDETPYLGSEFVGKAFWHVVVPHLKLELPSTPDWFDNSKLRTFDALVEPQSGRVVRLTSWWPEGDGPVIVQPDSTVAAEQLRRSGNEVYHGLPDHDPQATLIQALDAIQRGGAAPLMAKQISANYVMWSRIGKWRNPRSVWAITLRGVMPEMPREGMPIEPIYQYRYIVDAVTGQYLCSSNTPRPIDKKSVDR